MSRAIAAVCSGCLAFPCCCVSPGALRSERHGTYAGGRIRREACAICGGVIAAPVNDRTAIAAAVRSHNLSAAHARAGEET